DAVEGLQQIRDTAGVALRLVPQPAEITLPTVQEQRSGVIEAGRGALVVSPVAGAPEGLDPLLPRALAQVLGGAAAGGDQLARRRAGRSWGGAPRGPAPPGVTRSLSSRRTRSAFRTARRALNPEPGETAAPGAAHSDVSSLSVPSCGNSSIESGSTTVTPSP